MYGSNFYGSDVNIKEKIKKKLYTICHYFKILYFYNSFVKKLNCSILAMQARESNTQMAQDYSIVKDSSADSGVNFKIVPNPKNLLSDLSSTFKCLYYS